MTTLPDPAGNFGEPSPLVGNLQVKLSNVPAMESHFVPKIKTYKSDKVIPILPVSTNEIVTMSAVRV